MRVGSSRESLSLCTPECGGQILRGGCLSRAITYIFGAKPRKAKDWSEKGSQ